MLTRTPEQVALSETSRMCKEIADLCRDAAGDTDESSLRRLLTTLPEQHDTVRARVDERIRALGDLPRMPDADGETFKELATRVKKVFSSDPRDVVLDERIEDEEELLSHVADALKMDLDPATRACLEEAQRTATAALEALKSERAVEPR